MSYPSICPFVYLYVYQISSHLISSHLISSIYSIYPYPFFVDMCLHGSVHKRLCQAQFWRAVLAGQVPGSPSLQEAAQGVQWLSLPPSPSGSKLHRKLCPWEILIYIYIYICVCVCVLYVILYIILCAILFIYAYVWTHTDRHTLAQKHLIELLVWNASHVQKQFSKPDRQN